MNNPAAYCVRCKEYTDTSNAHTVLLRNNSRALTGLCPKCSNKVYMIVPRDFKREERKSIYRLDTVFSHTAYCVKCKKSTQVNYAHGVVFQNGRKALRGQCESCGCDAYKILKEKIVIRDVSASRPLTGMTKIRSQAETMEAAIKRPKLTYLAYAGIVVAGAVLVALYLM